MYCGNAENLQIYLILMPLNLGGKANEQIFGSHFLSMW